MTKVEIVQTTPTTQDLAPVIEGVPFAQAVGEGRYAFLKQNLRQPGGLYGTLSRTRKGLTHMFETWSSDDESRAIEREAVKTPADWLISVTVRDEYFPPQGSGPEGTVLEVAYRGQQVEVTTQTRNAYVQPDGKPIISEWEVLSPILAGLPPETMITEKIFFDPIQQLVVKYVITIEHFSDPRRVIKSAEQNASSTTRAFITLSGQANEQGEVVCTLTTEQTMREVRIL